MVLVPFLAATSVYIHTSEGGLSPVLVCVRVKPGEWPCKMCPYALSVSDVGCGGAVIFAHGGHVAACRRAPNLYLLWPRLLTTYPSTLHIRNHGRRNSILRCPWRPADSVRAGNQEGLPQARHQAAPRYGSATTTFLDLATDSRVDKNPGDETAHAKFQEVCIPIPAAACDGPA